MEKVISEKKREREEKYKALMSDYKKLMKKGSDKTAVYEVLAKKYNYKRAASVCNIVKKYTRKKE